MKCCKDYNYNYLKPTDILIINKNIELYEPNCDVKAHEDFNGFIVTKECDRIVTVIIDDFCKRFKQMGYVRMLLAISEYFPNFTNTDFSNVVVDECGYNYK